MLTPTSADLIRTIAELSPRYLYDSEAAPLLRRTTQALIQSMRQDGRLQESPMTLALTRSVNLHQEAAERRLRGRRVLVTGGSGCVGARLRELLASFGPAMLVNLDIAPHHGEGTGLLADIRDTAALDAAFAQVRPQVIFHLASIREPGRAELEVQVTTETNVFGTANVIEACRKHGVEQAVYSSTGKCYAYLTDHVYTASKKLAETMWMTAAQQAGPTRFAMTRFTHVLENGIVARDIMQGIEAGMVGLHGADRHFNIQNLQQATHLLVNALALAGEQAADGFWSAVDLGWPVNTLELALYEISRSGRDAGVRFLGVPKGYDENFFRGQFDWSGDYEYHPLVNALEVRNMFTDSTATMIGARVSHCPNESLLTTLRGLRDVLDRTRELPTDEGDAVVKSALLTAVAQVTSAVFKQVSPFRLLDILWWGAAPEWVGTSASAVRFRPLMRILADLVLAALEHQNVPPDGIAQRKLLDIASTFSNVPGLEPQTGRIAALTHPLQAA
jgi:nucleoside-diphosphate-sugar epimerase